MSVLRAENLSFEFASNPVLRDINLLIEPGEVVGLIGPNGAGKTTLLRTLAGLLTPSAGSVLLNDAPLDSISDRTRAKALAYLPQGAPAHWPLTVERVVELGRIPHRFWWQALTANDQALIDRALALTDVSALRTRVVTELSGGERTRVMLARVLAAEPALILADEPVASLDPFHQLRVMETLRGCAAGEGAAGTGAVLVVLHDLNLAARYCDRLIALDDGAVICNGPVTDVLENPLLAAAYQVSIDVVEDQGRPWVRYRSESD